jgi:hypothetical protein
MPSARASFPSFSRACAWSSRQPISLAEGSGGALRDPDLDVLSSRSHLRGTHAFERRASELLFLVPRRGAEVDEERIRRVASNEALFRKVNEQIEGLNDAFSALTDRIVIVCECGDPSCIEQIDLSRSEYEDVRTAATQFAVKPDHVFDDVEHVVAKTDRYWLVRKDAGEPARVARELDTRER